MEGVEYETRFSRQTPLMGEEGMKRLGNSTVLIDGLNGVGLEIAKNLLLSGVGRVLLHDSNCVTSYDLSSQFYLLPKDVGKNRVEANIDKLRELNEFSVVDSYVGRLNGEIWQLLHPPNVIVTSNHTLNGSLVELDLLCRNHGTKLVVVEVYGLSGLIVCDFGDDFTFLNGTGKEYLDIVLDGTKDCEGGAMIVQSVDNLDVFLDGIAEESWLKFFSDDNSELNGKIFQVTEVKSKKEFKVDAADLQDKISKQVRASRVFRDAKGSHVPLSAFIEHRHSFPRDPTKTHAIIGIKTIARFIEKEGRLPLPHNSHDSAQFFALAKEDLQPIDLKPTILSKFINTASGVLNPMAAIFGGFASQEVMKGCTGKYSPIAQLFMSGLDWLHDASLTAEAFTLNGTRHDGQIAVFGTDVQAALSSLRVFMIGAGAIGCELLKNLATMGVSCGTDGMLHVTDADDIALSNLHRQFLFRKEHISRQKSEVAAEIAKILNPTINIRSYTAFLSESTTHMFGSDTFFEHLDVLLPAVDSVEAREFIDTLSLFYSKSMLDSGTEGLSGTTQVILPSGTKRYAGSTAHSLHSAVGCYEKSFPYLSEHCILIGLGRFKELFEDIPNRLLHASPQDYNDQISNDSVEQLHDKWVSSQKSIYLEFQNKTHTDYNSWAYQVFEQLFQNNIQSIQEKYPENYSCVVDGKEVPFWNNKVRRPRVLVFDTNDDVCGLFLKSGVNLIHRVFSTSGRCVPEVFEKDDPCHIDFIYAISCLICDCYYIPRPQKFIAGRMSIAIVSSTAIAAGLTCLNLYRVAMDKVSAVQPDYRNYRNSSFSTAWNNLTVCVPMYSADRQLLEVPISMDWTVQQVVDALSEVSPYVLFYGKGPKDDSMMELWRHPNNGGMCNGAPPPTTPLSEAFPMLHNKRRAGPFQVGKYIGLLCEKEDCDDVVVKLKIV